MHHRGEPGASRLDDAELVRPDLHQFLIPAGLCYAGGWTGPGWRWRQRRKGVNRLANNPGRLGFRLCLGLAQCIHCHNMAPRAPAGPTAPPMALSDFL